MIGNNIFSVENTNAFTGFSESVFVGYNIGSGSAGGNFSVSGSTLVGGAINVISAANPNGSRAESIVIGHQASVNGQEAIQIGWNSFGLRGTRNRLIGNNNDFNTTGGAAGTTDNFIIGNNLTNANFGTLVTGSKFALCQDVNNFLMYGGFATGNIVLGKSSNAQKDLDTIASTNALKLVDGTRGAGNPNTGGFFYSIGGILHWVNSAGVDQNISMQAFTVATLPAAGPVGNRAYVTDALAPAFGAAVAAGGAVTIPVFYNGAAWIVG
jgi:hypothetical protein